MSKQWKITIVLSDNPEEGEDPFSIEEIRTYITPYGIPAGLKTESIDIEEVTEDTKKIGSNFRNRFILTNLNTNSTYISGDEIPEGLYQLKEIK